MTSNYYHDFHEAGDIRLIKDFFGHNLAAITILGSVVFGFFLSDIGNYWKPYTPYLLMLLMFSTVLTIRPRDIAESAKDTRSLASAIFIVFVIGPALAFTGRFLFSPATFAGIILALCAPSAVATAYYSGLFNGDTAYGLVMSITTNLIAILTIPTTMFLTVGTVVSLDLTSMFLNLAELILVPAIIAFLAQRVMRSHVVKVSRHTSKINLAILFFLIWASIAPGSAYARQNLLEFMWLSILMFAVLATLFVVSYRLVVRLGRKKAITTGVAASVRNGALALVLATTFSNPEIILPLVANLVAQSLLLVCLGGVLRDG